MHSCLVIFTKIQATVVDDSRNTLIRVKVLYKL